MPITNIPSVMQYGILSNELSAKLPHDSVAMTEIQKIRDNVQIPGGLRLHQYANLYFHARNPMMYKRKDKANTLCVLQVSCAVLKGDNVVLTDQNASSNYVRFLSPNQLYLIDFDLVYATDWRHPNDKLAYFRHKAAKCAEVLVPGSVLPELIFGAYVLNKASQSSLLAIGFNLPITINPTLFFC